MTQPRRLSGAAVPLAALTDQFSMRLGRSVVDMTGLTGTFDMDLQWTSDESQLPVSEQSPDARAPASNSEGQTIIMALQEQLGLKLESQKGPVEVLVIDHAERPSAN